MMVVSGDRSTGDAQVLEVILSCHPGGGTIQLYQVVTQET